MEPWAAGDFSGFVSALDERIKLTSYVPEGHVSREGREQVLRFLSEFVAQWNRYRVEVDEVTEIQPGAILLSGTQQGIGASSGLSVSESVHVVCVFQGERLVATHWHVDRQAVLAAADLPAQPPGVGLT